MSNESGRAYEAFKVYMFMSPAERSVVGAWREWTGNPEAVRPSPYFEDWAREYAWSERARAHDHHLDRIRERGIEKAIEAEAEMQARDAERTRYRYNELMTLGYERAMEWLENAQPSDFRPQDVIQIIRLHMDAVKVFEVTEKPNEEVTWTEEEAAELTQIIREIEAEGQPKEGAEEGVEEDSEESKGEPG